jgi:hypothetical protein
MKLVYKMVKEYRQHIDYVADISPTLSVHLVLPRDILRTDRVPYNIVAYQHKSSSDPKLHLCHKCSHFYPAFKYAQHAKEHHGIS